MSKIVTVYEDKPCTTFLGERAAVAVLPDGRRFRLGDTVTGSYARPNDVRGPVIGWTPDEVVIGWDSGSLELGPQDVLTVEAAR